MKSVLISIKPQWCELIASGEKTLEVRKSRPKLDAHFKCYIYCSKSKRGWFDFGKKERLDGRIIGEFICDHTYKYSTYGCVEDDEISTDDILTMSCLTPQQLRAYELKSDVHIGICGWHISNLKIYDKPKELSEFEGLRKTKFGYEPVSLERAPQSWCYVKAIE